MCGWVCGTQSIVANMAHAQHTNFQFEGIEVYTKHKVTVKTRRIYALASEGFEPSGLFQGEAEIMLHSLRL